MRLIYLFDGTFGHKMIESCKIDESKFYPDRKIEFYGSVMVNKDSHGVIKVVKNGNEMIHEIKF